MRDYRLEGSLVARVKRSKVPKKANLHRVSVDVFFKFFWFIELAADWLAPTEKL
jgi:hypothetical protein